MTKAKELVDEFDKMFGVILVPSKKKELIAEIEKNFVSKDEVEDILQDLYPIKNEEWFKKEVKPKFDKLLNKGEDENG